MTHYPETPWNLTPRQQEAMDAMVATGSVKLAALVMRANQNTAAELIRQARERMDAGSLTMAALMWDRYRRAATQEPKDDWIHARVTKDQAARVKAAGGSEFVRRAIDATGPVRIESVWGKAA